MYLFVLKIFKKLIVEVNLIVVTSRMHLVPLAITAFIGLNTSIECHFSNTYVQ